MRRLRDSRGWTQETFAAKCNLVGLDLSRASLSKIEAGLRRVVDAEIPKLAKALQVPISDLFEDGGKSGPESDF